jgi:ABC-2 type transport system ATP-binding protein
MMGDYMSIIQINQLTKYYGKQRGVEKIDLSVEKGEIFGFIGPNGAGKSTTIRVLLGLLKPTSGSATIFDLDVTNHGPEILKRVGYLPSEVFYYDNMKVIDLLKYAASFYKKDCTARIKELAAILDLDLNRKIEDLSYGNRKKVGIVQGLLHQPDLIILDEPTGGLDPLMQQTFFSLLKQEQARGATILFSSHILSEVQKLCDRVAIIKDGRIVRVDKVSTITADTYVKISFKYKGYLDISRFNMTGITNFTASDEDVSFLFKGDINLITTALSQTQLTSLQVTEPDLEEIFLHYYQPEKNYEHPEV